MRRKKKNDKNAQVLELFGDLRGYGWALELGDHAEESLDVHVQRRLLAPVDGDQLSLHRKAV
jgi:hypothetical protein